MSHDSFKGLAQRRHEMQRTSPWGAFVKWLKLKHYQISVTIPIYMLTPLEQLAFYAVVLSLVSLFFIAVWFYLPGHVTTIYCRVMYYVQGSGGSVTSTIADAMRTTKDALSHPTPSPAFATTAGRLVKEL